ncbi:MAG TPA: DUF2238 domain-containing protein [Candidatus Nanoarchaeia archaeon]|nr:DUF2238 domain-containing protein [Candidatus Nanoarchaeia archaeon]
MIERKHIPLLITLVVAMLIFGLLFFERRNIEFLIYIAVIAVLAIIIGISDRKVHYSAGVLWSMLVWAILHMAGGGVRFSTGILYTKILIPLSSTYEVLRYDQVVHMFGFGAATVLMYEVLKPHLKQHRGFAVAIATIMAGLGLGALNEIVEFTLTVLLPQTGVGGYLNTGLDLVADLIGALAAWIIIRWRNI